MRSGARTSPRRPARGPCDAGQVLATVRAARGKPLQRSVQVWAKLRGEPWAKGVFASAGVASIGLGPCKGWSSAGKVPWAWSMQRLAEAPCKCGKALHLVHAKVGQALCECGTKHCTQSMQRLGKRCASVAEAPRHTWSLQRLAEPFLCKCGEGPLGLVQAKVGQSLVQVWAKCGEPWSWSMKRLGKRCASVASLGLGPGEVWSRTCKSILILGAEDSN